MSQSNEDNLCDTYSNVKEVRQLIDIKIDYLKQLLDERRIQLNHELDEIEQEVVSSDEKSRMLIQKLIDYENITISLFGEIDSSSHVSSIKSKISSLEQELDRQKVYFKWRGGNIAVNMESLGSVGFESNDIYENVDKLFKEETKLPKLEEKTTLTEECSKAISIEEIHKEKYMRVVSSPKPPPIANKPRVPNKLKMHNSRINKPTHHYEDLSDLLKYREKSIACSEQATNRDEELTYESFEPNTGSKPDKTLGRASTSDYSDGGKMSKGELQEPTYETMKEYIEMEPCKPPPNFYPQQDYEIIDESILIDPIQLYEAPVVKAPNHAVIKTRSKSLTIGREQKKWVYDLPIISACNQGTGMGELNRPKGVCISDTGKIFVAEKGNNRVQVFSKDGNHLYMFGQRNKMVEPNNIWTSSQFVYVTLPNLNTIQMYTVQGGFLKQRAKEGKEEGRLKLPCGISGDTLRERLYVCDTGNNRIQIFDYNLHFIQVMRTTVPLDKPLDIQITNNRNLIIVLDRSPRCIHMFKGSGELIKEIIDTHTFPKLVNPLYLTTQNESILLSDYSSNCVHVFSDKGELIWRIGESGKGKPFDEPRGLACDKDGRLVTVCNRKKDQLQIFEI